MRTILASLLALLLLQSCNPVKRLLKRQEMADRIIADYLSKNPPMVDTVFLKGEVEYHSDTIVNENIYVDTVRIQDTVWVHQTKYRNLLKTVRVVDTILYRSNIKTSSPDNMLLTDRLREANRLKHIYLGALVILASICLLSIAYRFFK